MTDAINQLAAAPAMAENNKNQEHRS